VYYYKTSLQKSKYHLSKKANALLAILRCTIVDEWFTYTSTRTVAKHHFKKKKHIRTNLSKKKTKKKANDHVLHFESTALQTRPT
jgi:hypothetical protein